MTHMQTRMLLMFVLWFPWTNHRNRVCFPCFYFTFHQHIMDTTMLLKFFMSSIETWENWVCFWCFSNDFNQTMTETPWLLNLFSCMGLQLDIIQYAFYVCYDFDWNTAEQSMVLMLYQWCRLKRSRHEYAFDDSLIISIEQQQNSVCFLCFFYVLENTGLMR